MYFNVLQYYTSNTNPYMLFFALFFTFQFDSIQMERTTGPFRVLYTQDFGASFHCNFSTKLKSQIGLHPTSTVDRLMESEAMAGYRPSIKQISQQESGIVVWPEVPPPVVIGRENVPRPPVAAGSRALDVSSLPPPKRQELEATRTPDLLCVPLQHSPIRFACMHACIITYIPTWCT